MEGTDRSERAARRGWGPFTGGQLTIIIVAVVVMMLLPVGAWALSASNVIVSDANSGAHATVNAAGALTVNVASPKTFFMNSTLPEQHVSAGLYTPVAVAPPNHALVITSVAIDILKVTTPDQVRNVGVAVSKTDATCNSVVLPNGDPPILFNPADRGAIDYQFQPGIPIPSGRALCARAGGAISDFLSDVSAFGYTVPASATLPGA